MWRPLYNEPHIRNEITSHTALEWVVSVFMHAMRILGLDVGSKTIGVAVSDLMGWTAQGVTTLQRTGLTQDIDALQKLMRDYETKTFVVGLPLHMNGDESDQARVVRKLMEALEKVSHPLEVIYWDERLSSVGAERALLEADLSRSKRKQVINKMAAVFILQGYLDFKSGPGAHESFEQRESVE